MSMANDTAANGRIRNKIGFTAASNAVIKDRNLSLKAKGLYMVIQRLITIPSFTLYLNTLKKECKEGEWAFNAAWKELKDNGYLVQHRTKNQAGRFVWEYELLDEKRPVNKSSLHTPKNHPMENHTMENPPVGNPTDGEVGVFNKTDLNKKDINKKEKIKDRLIDMTSKQKFLEHREKYGFEELIYIVGYDENLVRELESLIYEVIISNKETERIGGEDMSIQQVKDVLLQLDSYHLEYVLDSVSSTKSQITNMRNYLLTALYNAPQTLWSHKAAQRRASTLKS